MLFVDQYPAPPVPVEFEAKFSVYPVGNFALNVQTRVAFALDCVAK